MRALLLILALMLALAAGAIGQPRAYTLLPSGDSAPAPRFDAPIAYDPASRTLYVFGGSDGRPMNDLWQYSLAQRRWSEVRVDAAAAKPAPRFGHTMLFDPARRRLIVFGGEAGGFFSDTWAFQLDRGAWEPLARDDAGPSRRYAHSAIYDAARDRMVISHGFTDAGRFDDTWAFDFRSNTWRNISPSSGRPVRRCLHHAVYDGGNAMYLYGGCASGFGPCPLGDLWSFDLAANRWTELRPAAAAPAARERYGLTFDTVRQRLVLFGGSGRGLLNDTWEFDPRAGRWQEAAIAGTPPGPRSRHESVFAPDRATSFFFGGSSTSGLTNELWMLGPAFVTPTPAVNSVSNAFSGEGGAVSPGELVSIYGSSLGPIDGIAFRYERGTLPSSGPGVAVTVNGVAAPLLYASASQVNIQVPYEIAGAAEATIAVTVNGERTAYSVPLRATHAGLFPSAFHPGGQIVTAENPLADGGVAVLYATGHGVTAPPSATGAEATAPLAAPAARVSVRIGGRAAEILFAGQAPGTTGVLQINVRVPVGRVGDRIELGIE